MNRLLRQSLIAAAVAHLVVFTAGGWLAPRFHTSADSGPMRTIDVGLEAPKAARVTAPPVPEPKPSLLAVFRPSPSPTREPATPDVAPPEPAPAAPRAEAAPRQDPPPVEPGGALNTGTASERGDLPGLPTGQTPAGWVPGADDGRGAGSGSGAGVGTPEPPPAPAPAPPPAPRRVGVRVCAETRLRHNPYCPQITTIEVEEGSEPGEVCSKHQPPPRKVSVRVCAQTRLRSNPHCPQVVSIEVEQGSEPRAACVLHKPPPPPVAVAAVPRPDPTPPAAERPREAPFKPARLIHTVTPRYPEAARDDSHQGAVRLKAQVRRDGTCGDVEVTRSSGSRVLDAAAVKAVKQWRWEPARRGDEAVETSVPCRVRFELED